MLRIKNLPLLLISFFLLYIYLNLELLIWDILNPGGFWGIIWFYLLSFLLLASFFIIWDILDLVIMMRKVEKTKFQNLIWVGAFLLLGTGIYYGSAIALPWIFYNRYKYIERSEKFFDKGKYSAALEYSEKVLKKASLENDPRSKLWIVPYLYGRSKKVIERKHFRYYQAAINNAYCLQAIGNQNRQAVEGYDGIINFSKEYLSDKPQYLILPLMGKAMIYLADGKNIESERCFNELTTYVNKMDRSDVDNMVQTLLFYSIYAQKNGDYDKSFRLRKQAQEVYLNSGKSLESTIYLSLVLNVASDLINSANYEEAKKILIENKKTARKRNDRVIYLNYLKMEAQIAEHEGDLIKSERILKDILKRIRKNQGKKHLDYAKSLYDLALFDFRNGKISSASEEFSEALNLIKENSPTSKPVYYKILLGKALNDFAESDFGEIETNLSEIESFLYDQINENFLFLTEDEREKYVLSLSGQIDLINSVYIGINKRELASKIYNNILSTKSIALQSNQYLRRIILNSQNNDLIQLFEKVVKEKEKLSAINFSDPKYLLDSSQLELSLLKKEKELFNEIQRLPGFRQFDVNAVSWEDVRTSLKENEAAIEYINLPSKPNDYSEKTYYALILRKGYDIPLLIKLFDEEKVVSLLTRNGSTKERISAIYSDGNIKDLYNLIWAPIETHLQGISKVYISLSGILHQISFPAILAKNREEIVFLGSTRTVAESSANGFINKETSTILYGGIDYNYDSITTSDTLADRSSLNDLQSLISRTGFKDLPNTKDEIEKISVLFKEKGFFVSLVSGRDATEESFKTLSNRNVGLIHFATHGYYYPTQNKLESLSPVLGNEINSEMQNPLFRSGLLLAGANNPHKLGGNMDGILTAFEISNSDLHTVDLVVMSACETGLGDLKGNEGVFGLQRAFKMAGVRSIIMSLWKVPDLQTSELMELFYKYYISGNSKQMSLTMAQKELRDKYENPFYWAAFIVME